MGRHYAVRVAVATLVVFLSPQLQAVDLEKIKQITSSSASDDFAGSQSAYNSACEWHTELLLRHRVEDIRAPYIVCANYREGRSALNSLERAFSTSAIHRVSNGEAAGSCFIVTVSPAAGTALTETPEIFSLLSAAPFLPPLKLANGLLDHEVGASSRRRTVDAPDLADGSEGLRSTYGDAISFNSVRGLSVRLSPGILAVDGTAVSPGFLRDWHADLMSERVIMSTLSFWSDPGVNRSVQDETRVREWSRAAAVVDGLASKHNRPVGEICKLGGLRMRHVGDDLLLMEGLEHLLPGKTAPSEVKMACFMCLLSQLAATPEVLRISPLHRANTLNSVGSAVVQSATTTEKSLLEAGLDGTGEVIQIVDAGLDETSCYFADDDGLPVEHGYLFLGGRFEADGNVSLVLGNDSFASDMSRRKVG